jgi:hypothetical protein
MNLDYFRLSHSDQADRICSRPVGVHSDGLVFPVNELGASET